MKDELNFKNTQKSFKEINNANDLIRYLSDSSNRLANSGYVYHYTTLSVVVNMIKGKLWHLGNAKNMNDRLEYENGDENRWKNIFLAVLWQRIKKV